jgi:eukaryotic-like serine/threonine-protein kinase
MRAERWQQINDLFQSAAERTPAERPAFLDEACHGDKTLRREVVSLIAAYERAENFIETPAFEVAPELLTNDKTGALIGESIGHYRIESLIGVGGMGEVYLARDELLGRKVALKLLPQRLTTDETQLSRFKSEARTASALNHPNILTVYEIGTEGDRHFIATEFIEGVTLRASLAHGRMNLHDALEIAAQVASALAAAHETGIVHRDIKPENIMLRPDGYAKVLDFGIAKLTEQQPVSGKQDAKKTSLVLGTVRYMSPEQSRGQPVDVRTDIWSLGVVLHEMVTGTPPFSGETPSDCIASILKSEPAPLSGALADVPTKLQSIVQKALHKNPDERYQTTRELLADLRNLKRELEAEGDISKIKRHKRGGLLTLGAATLAASASVYFFYFTPPVQPPSEKSIAVLPFADLSPAHDQEYFCDGVQDQILTNLAQIADLKVISRTSVMQYKSGVARNLREISQQLGVAHLLEGSVQRAANRVRVNAKLIDARTDAHLWAQTYDGDLADVFAIQSEIAKAIGEQLQAKLSPNEKKAIEQPPTTDLAAFDLYSRAKSLLLRTTFSVTGDPDLRKAIELLDEAVKRDPSFFDAYCQLAFAHEYLYGATGSDHTPARLALAETAVQAATRLRPDAAETHLARAQYLYYGLRDYAGALAELEIARRALPNDPRLFELTGYILRRRGQQEEGLQNLQRATELDPRNFFTLQQIAISYQNLGRYAESIAPLDRALAIVPDNIETRATRGEYCIYWKADTQPLHQTIDAILAQGPSAIASAADAWFACALAERDPAAAERALVALGDNPCWGESTIYLSHSFGEGLLARMSKDEARARTAFEAARAQQEKIVQAQPDYGPALCVLGLIDAALGRKDLALDEGRRAIALTPVEKDLINGSRVLQYFAITAAWAGNKELALQQLEAGLRAPTASLMLSYGALKLFPVWDPLRGDARFEKIVASLAPELPANSAPEKSIAVLPFADLSPARDQEYFCGGIQEEILTRLSRIADLKVISRTSTQRFKSAPDNLPQIARQLGVAHILEGTVQKVDDQVRVTVQLIKAENDSHLWSEKYDRKLTDIFAVESEIATNIAAALQAKLTGAEQRAIATRPTENPEAHLLSLKGMYFLNKRTAHDLRSAIEYFKEAIGKDANYALAYAGLADAYTILSVLRGEGPTATVSKAKAAARKALQLDDTLPEAHNSLGLVLAYYDFDFAQSKKEFERAIELNPNYADAHHQLGNVNLIKVGEFDRAIAEGTRAVELDPLSLIINADLGQNYFMARRYDEAIEQNRKTLTLDPRFYFARWNLGEALQMKGQLREAIAEYEKTVDLTDDPRALAMLAQGYARIGETEKARNLLSQLEQMAAHRYVGAFSFALIHLGLDENEKAFAEIERACREPVDPDVINLKIYPLLDPLRGDPRFERLVAKVLGGAEKNHRIKGDR